MEAPRLLIVCTGNICRSPQIQQFLLAGLEQRQTDNPNVPFPLIISMGTNCHPGQAMPEQAQEMSRKLGGNPHGHVATALTAAAIRDADLVLTASRDHRGVVARLVPAATKKTFTLREFSRIVAGTKRDLELREQLDLEGDIAGWAAIAARRRGLYNLPNLNDDILDPYRQTREVYDASATQIFAEVSVILSVLWPIQPSTTEAT